MSSSQVLVVLDLGGRGGFGCRNGILLVLID